MNGKQLKNSILQWAIQGKLVPQDPNDEPASVLLERIRAEKTRLVKEGKIKKNKNESIIYRGEDNSHYEKFPDGRVVCIDDEIPFEIPTGWEWTRLGNIGSWGSGATPSKGHPEYYSNGTIPWLTTGELNDGVVYDTRTKVSQKALNNCSLRVCHIGDILIAMYGATIGKVAIAGCELTTNQACCACTPFYGYNKYLFYYLMANKVVFNQMGEGGAQPNISKEKIVGFLFALPPIQEQKRIVEKIELVLPRIDKYGRSQEALNRLNNNVLPLLRKSILQDAIQGRLTSQDQNDQPSSTLLDQIRAEKQKLLKEGKLKKKDIMESIIFKGEDNKYYEKVGGKVLDISEEIPFDLPESWVWSRLAVIVHYRIGKTPTRGETAFWESGTIPWVSISDMKEYGHVTQTREKVTPKATSLFGQISRKCTLLMSFKLTVGRTAILDIDAYHNEAIISIWPYVDEEALKHYLFYALPLLANLGDSKDAIKGKTLNTNSINNLLIPIPPSKEQIAIVKKIEELYTRL